MGDGWWLDLCDMGCRARCYGHCLWLYSLNFLGGYVQLWLVGCRRACVGLLWEYLNCFGFLMIVHTCYSVILKWWGLLGLLWSGNVFGGFLGSGVGFMFDF